MTASKFSRALDHVLRHEGGYVDHPHDPGGATNMGITRQTLAAWRGRPVSKVDVRRLRWCEAAGIYRARYWKPMRCDKMPHGLDYAVFDAAVNSGPRRAALWLQSAVGAEADGIVGPKTLGRVHSCDPCEAVRRLCATRLVFLQRLRTWPTFGTGWSRRVRDVEREALRLAAKS